MAVEVLQVTRASIIF